MKTTGHGLKRSHRRSGRQCARDHSHFSPVPPGRSRDTDDYAQPQRQHHYEETQTIDKLLQANTDLTQQVHVLTQKVHELTEHLCTTSGVALKGVGSQSP